MRFPLPTLLLVLLFGLLALTGPLMFMNGPVRRVTAGFTLPFMQLKSAAATGVEQGLDTLTPPSKATVARIHHQERLIEQLRMQLLNARNAVDENREFRQYSELPAPPDWKLVVAPVIARDPLTWNRRFRIGKGSANGLAPGAAVLAGNQVIGRVLEVTPNSAVVLTVADPACRLGVRLPATNAVGILAGRQEQKWHEPPICLVTYLPRDNSYTDEEFVVTSGLGGTVPPGLPIGRIVPWEDQKTAHLVSAAYAQVLVRPNADFTLFQFVAVVVPRGPWPVQPGSAAEGAE